VLYAARTYAALGVDCRVVTSAAADDRDEVAAAFPASIELVLLPSSATTAFENAYAASGARTQRAPALAPPLPRRETFIAGASLVQLGPLHPADLDDAWYGCRGAAHALDLQGLTRRVVAGHVEAALDPRVRTILPRCAWIKGSEDEWHLAGSSVDGCRDAERLVTRGIDGGELITSEGTHRWRADPPIDPCDPTGAGDVHFAAYLAHRAHGDAPEAAAAAAARFTSAFLASRQ
jgi:sugar/nucleoside kinase (ribokinase family)